MKRTDQEWTDTYYRLKAAGHSIDKAIEIIVDAKRGKQTAIDWILLVEKYFKGEPDAK